jgi:periplasmic copper chaperone A
VEAIVKFYRVSILAILAFIPSLAAAHVGISGPAIANKSGQKVTFAITHGCTKDDKHLDTLSIKIDIPTGIDPASVRAMPNDFAPTPTVTKNGANVVSAMWSRNPAELQSDDVAFYEFTLRLKVNDVPFTRIPFVVTQVCRPKGGTELDDVTVVWTGPPSVPEPSPQLVVVPAHSPGWNKITLTTAVAAKDFGAFFGDAQVVWKGTSAFSPNATVTGLIGTTTGVTPLTTDLAAGDEIWVKY